MEIREKIIRAYNELLAKDAHLFSVSANERSITHRFAIYLEHEFREYSVDCEYDRVSEQLEGSDDFRKRISNFRKEIGSDDRDAVTVYPDIIVHHRGTKDNFVVIEAKKTSNTNTGDKRKLEFYKNDLGYRHAFFVLLPVGDDFDSFDEGKMDEYIIEIE